MSDDDYQYFVWLGNQVRGIDEFYAGWSDELSFQAQQQQDAEMQENEDGLE